MKHYILLLIMTVALAGCRSASDLLHEGRYEKAAYSAAAQLKKNPSDMDMRWVLAQSYKATINYYDSLVNLSERKGSRDRFEKQYEYYKSLQQLSTALWQLPPEATSNIAIVSYQQQLSALAPLAAAARYDLGIKLLDQHNKADAYQAWLNFQKAEEFDPNYKDVAQMVETAYQAALTLVEVNIVQERLPLFNIQAAWLKQEIIWNLETINPGKSLLKFALTEDIQGQERRPDQTLLLDFTGLRFDTPQAETYSYERTKEITITDDEGHPKVITVKATVYVTRRLAIAHTVLRADLRSMADSRTLLYQLFPAEYTWRSLNGRFTGDERALSAEDLAIINATDTPPPDRSELFRMLSEKCINDLTFRLREMY